MIWFWLTTNPVCVQWINLIWLMDNSDMFHSTFMGVIIYYPSLIFETIYILKVKWVHYTSSFCDNIICKTPIYLLLISGSFFSVHDKCTQMDNNRYALVRFTQGETTIKNSPCHAVSHLWQSLTFNRCDVILFHYFNLREYVSQFRDAFILIVYPLLFL